jgi:uncharacterized protein (TIRG00374 family)
MLLYFAFKGINLHDLLIDLKNANYLWVFLSLLLAIFGFLIRAYRWKLLIEPLGFNPHLRNTFYALMVGYSANFVLPRLGEITRCGSLNKSENVPFDALLGTVIVERIIDILILLVLLLFIFFIKMEFFGNFLKEHIFIPLIHKFSGFFDFSFISWLIFLVVIIIIGSTYYVFKERLSKRMLFRKTNKIISGISSGFKAVYKLKKRKVFIFNTIFLWLVYFFMTWLLVFAIPETSQLKAIDGLFILVIGSLGMSAPVQGGIGAFHWIVSLGLTLYGIPKKDGLVFATISHESQAILIVLLGSLSVFMLLLQQKKSRALNQQKNKTNKNG